LAEKQKPLGWKDIPAGAVVDKPGNAREYLTGGWRSQRPVFKVDRCIGCGTCYLYCPDAAIVMNRVEPPSRDLPPQLPDILLDYCKGCGVCARECSMVALTGVSCFEMRDEEEFR
jgi:pyruvate ferredoxin oxidoreductase delta subunit